MAASDAIREIVDRETHAWNTKDVPLLLGVFHPDMVWAWPETPTAIDPPSLAPGVGQIRSGALGRPVW
ncbi:MAG: hypothetical protein M3123_07280 [Actinomycetota bacterium]|nr:hypothetical protein [Actinomycetota bacterium]